MQSNPSPVDIWYQLPFDLQQVLLEMGAAMLSFRLILQSPHPQTQKAGEVA